MKFRKIGITLRRITEEDIELVRQWRNSDHVRNFMEYREYITPEMQKEWFGKIDNPDNFFYIIEYENENVGLIFERKINWEGIGTTESGMFMSEPKYWDTFIPIFCSLFFIELELFTLGGRESYIRVLKDNQKAIDYNTNLGYVLCEGQENIYNQLYVLTKENFINKTKKLREAVVKLGGGKNITEIIIEPIDYKNGSGYFHENKIRNSIYDYGYYKEGDNNVFFLDLNTLDELKV